jgi:hypothetical protein
VVVVVVVDYGLGHHCLRSLTEPNAHWNFVSLFSDNRQECKIHVGKRYTGMSLEFLSNVVVYFFSCSLCQIKMFVFQKYSFRVQLWNYVNK